MKMTEAEQKRWHQQYEAALEQRRKELTQGTARLSGSERAPVQRRSTFNTGTPPRRG